MYCSFDIETSGLSPYKGARIFAYCIGYEDGSVEVSRYDKTKLQAFLNNVSIEKICHNLKFEYTFLKYEGYHIPPNTSLHDTMLMSQLLQNNNPHHSLDYLAWQFAKWPLELDKEIAAMGREYGGYQNIPNNYMHKYQVSDGQRTMLLFKTFWPYIEKECLADYQNEIELIKTTYEMEARGIMLHEKEMKSLGLWLEDEVAGIQDNLYKAVGEYLNLNSPIQVNHVLFKKLKLPVIKIKEDTGNFSTDKNVLLELRKMYPHPVIDLIIKQRSYTKGLAILRNYKKHSIDGIIHPTIKTNHAGTGREASERPNLQNVSKEEVLKNLFPVPSRKCFRPRPRFVFLLYDYSGIEIRLIADACGEEELIQLAGEGKDLHKPAVEIFFGKNFTKEQRTASKNGQFAIAYGAGAEALAQTLMISLEDAVKAKERYCTRFRKVGNYSASTIDEIRANGYIRTAFGRKLFINREMAYIGSNYRIQGTAAGIIKRAQNNIRKNISIPGLFLLLPIHDELIFELSRDLLSQKESISKKIAKEMTSMPEIKIRLDVEAKMTATNWNEAKEFKWI